MNHLRLLALKLLAIAMMWQVVKLFASLSQEQWQKIIVWLAVGIPVMLAFWQPASRLVEYL